MKIKSMFAAVAASALALSAMSLTAFAAEGDPVWYGGKVGVNSATTGWADRVEWTIDYGQSKLDNVTKNDAGQYVVRAENPFSEEFKADENYVQAWIQNWGPDDFKLVSVYFEGLDYNYPMEKMVDGDKNYTAYLVGGTKADPNIGEKTVDDAKKVTAIVWTFEAPSAEGTKAAEGTTTAAADDTAATTTAKADDKKTTTTAKADDKKNSSTTATKTGDAGVGVVVAGLTLAGAAAFIARKKH